MKKHRVKIILCLFFVFLGFAALEVTSRLRYQGDLRLIRDPDHRLIPDGQEINSDGLRSRLEASDFAPDGLNIMVLGDSFVYGWNLPAAQAFPQLTDGLLAAAHPELKPKLLNAGWHSSSPYLTLRLLKEVGQKYHPDVVVLCLDMTDFQDDIRYKHLVERDGLIYKGLSVAPGLVTFVKKKLSGNRMKDSGWHEALFDMPPDRFFAMNQPLEKSRPWLATTQSIIEEMNRYVRDELQARFILVVLPRPFQYSNRECPDNWEKAEYEVLGPYCKEPFVFFDELKPTAGYPIYSMLETFEQTKVFPHCFEDDPHWNEAGNAIAAQALYDILVTEGVVPKTQTGEAQPAAKHLSESPQP